MDQFKEFFNFDNVGSKIKNFTKWACWISIIVIWVAVGVCVIISMTDKPYGLGICAIVGGGILTFTTWVGSWTMYGFGEIVENNTGRNENKEEEAVIIKPEKIMESCDWCEKLVEKRWNIRDDKGFRWEICDDCMRKWEDQKDKLKK